MTPEHELESRYRRLMAAYPWRHRREYEEEMVGVLLAGAAPGQRRPRFRDRADLLVNALAVRVRGWAGGVRDDAWRRAASTVQIAGAMFLLAVALHRIAPGFVFGFGRGTFTAIEVARPVGWALVVAIALIGLRRTAAIPAIFTAAVEVVHVAGWYAFSPSQVLRSGWLVTIALIVAATSVWLALGAPVARPRGLWWSVAALALAYGGEILDIVQGWFYGPSIGVWVNGYFMVRLALPLYLVAVVLAVGAFWRQGGPVRRRLLTFAAPVVAVAAMVAYGFAGFMYSSQRFPSPVLLRPFQWAILGATPVVAFALAAAVLNRWERARELIALGRRAERGVSSASEQV
jgi:hypothetical protein